MKVIQTILAGTPFDMDEYFDASDFLHRSTCIDSRDDVTFFGRMPGSGLNKAAQEWQAWWETYHDYVYYVPDHDQLEFRDGRNTCDVRHQTS